MTNQEQFQKALTDDLTSFGLLKIKNLSVAQVYIPYLKMIGSIYLILCILAIVAVKLCVLLGFHVNRNSLLSIINDACLYNLIPLFFIMFGLGQGFILWSAIKSELKSTPFIRALMRHYLKCYCIIYVVLIFIFIVLLQCDDLAMIFPFTSLISMVLFMFFFNMENQRLGQGVLIDQLVKLFSHTKTLKDSD